MSEIMYKEFLLKEIFEPHQGNAIYTKKAIISNGWEGNVRSNEKLNSSLE